MDVNNLGFVGQLLFVAIGVATSVLIPVLLALVPKAPGRGMAATWPNIKPYVALGVVSFLIALLLLAFLASQGKELEIWWQAFLAGYAFDATMQKIKEGLSAHS